MMPHPRCISLFFACLITCGSINAAAGATSDFLHLGIPAPWEKGRLDASIGLHRVSLDLPLKQDHLSAYPPPVAQEVRQRLEFRTGNLSQLRALEQKTFTRIETGVIGRDEWDTSLNDLLISLHPSDAQLPSLLHRHRPVLDLLPSHTRLYIVVPASFQATVIEELQSLGLAQRATLIPAPLSLSREGGIDLIHTPTRWAQDLAEVSRDKNGRLLLFIPGSRYQIHDLTRPDNSYLTRLPADVTEVARTPLFFRGGNLLTLRDKTGQRVLLIGERELQNNRADTYNAGFFVPEPSAVLSMFRQITGADRVLVLPNSPRLYHLDLALQPLGNNRLAFLSPKQPQELAEEDRDALTQLRKLLKTEGFELVNIPTNARQINSFSSPVNFLAYRDPGDARLTLIVPRPADGLIEPVRNAYHNAGVRVQFAEDRFSAVRGGFHCAFLSLH